LRSPDRFHEHRRRKSGDGPERTPHIVGSYRGADLPHDRFQYPTSAGLIGLDLQGDDRCSHVERSPTILGDSLDKQRGGSE
jgi:hypothetical protein